MLTADFDYHLPPELIASEPLVDRSASRMMVLHRGSGRIEHRMFRDIGQFISADAGDRLVLNDTRVVPARYFTNHGHEVLRLEPLTPTRWRCMVRPGKKFRVGHLVPIGEATGTVVEILEENGDRIIEFDRVVDESKHGHLALPHYMGREDQPADRERYQTVFARQEGSIAAPTGPALHAGGAANTAALLCDAPRRRRHLSAGEGGEHRRPQDALRGL